MADIAAYANVSEGTVSRALAGSPLVAEKTRERIVRIAKKHGYAVNPTARSLRLGQTQTIAVTIPLRHTAGQHVSDPFLADMLAHLADALEAREYDLLLSRVAGRAENWIEAPIRARRADGVIIIGQSLEHRAIEDAARKGVPLVVWGAKMPRQRYVSVGTDNLAGGAMATRHLLERGRKNIAFLGDRRVPEVAQRYSGYTAALEQAGLKPNPGLDLPIPFGAEDALKALGDMVRSGRRIDGVVAASDVIAMSAIRALVEARLKVPDDVSVVGFDDLAIARYTSPPLTTVRQDVVTGARLLVDKLLAIMAGQRPESEQMQPELVARSSS